VLNISRVFLSGHGHIPVVVGSIITAAILLGATVLANSSRLRSQSITLMTVGFIFVVFCAGWLVLGSSQEKGEGTTPLAGGPYISAFSIQALPSIKFSPTTLTLPTGVYLAELKAAGPGHTLDFDDPKTLFAGVEVNSAGEVKSSRIFFGEPGDYTFFCAIPGHRATMNGVVHVTGSPITLKDAEAKGKLTAPA
jgi:plastocyanin